MIHQLKNRNFYLLVGADIIFFVVSLFMAYAARFTCAIPHGEYHNILVILPWLVSVKVATFFFMGVYRGMWRYTSIPDAVRLLKASLLATLIIMAGLTFLIRFSGYPRSVFIADSIFTLFFCGGIRAGIRMLFSIRQQIPGWKAEADDTPPHQTNLIIIGAGDAADKIIREVQGNLLSPFRIVCCLDDDSTKHHRSLLGIPVRGPVTHLKRFAEAFQATETLIAMPSVAGDRMREIVTLCEKSGLPFRTLPSLTSLIDGQVTINDLRPVNFEDLLGRSPVKLDIEGIGHYLTGKTVAVTGAGGSIGSELCRQIIRFKPAALILIEGSEFNLYRMEMELRTERKFPHIFPAMGRVQDRPLMDRIFEHYRPQVVFHAAACKHVPMVELNPWEAVFNNVLGSQTIMDTADKYGVERCVFISTDKAVRPTNVMGASKRVVEVLLQSRPASKTRFMAVRFGNVVGSSGSAIPLFQSQIKAGGPVTVTDPEMTRYFMTIPEASQLVLQAGSLGEGGEIFILEMGTPVKIADMARDLIRLSGKEPDRDIKIVYTGLRPGEKLYEELITHGEGIVPTPHEKIMVLRRDAATSSARRDQILATLAELTADANVHDAARIKATLNRLVPDYTPSDTASVLCIASRFTDAVA
ncbi:MAG: nucleoside-diphosphate sugar epimerase/dehydratase [bacterium]